MTIELYYEKNVISTLIVCVRNPLRNTGIIGLAYPKGLSGVRHHFGCAQLHRNTSSYIIIPITGTRSPMVKHKKNILGIRWQMGSFSIFNMIEDSAVPLVPLTGEQY